ncbi:hypothetical protein [Cryobacterium sp. Sr3]|uniref:hypothetical protein n=1 Tax=Cryobacterium sp. Sr3 TaxID=1259194 RepID=UPI00106C7D39|nr:hypothetical protein [Cryobacterium sp. Sr3]TFB53433.1 hypothetical protein E3N94_14700 [Cryobacterium sp. Sr3]
MAIKMTSEATQWTVELLNTLFTNGLSTLLAFALGLLYLKSNSRRLFRMRQPKRVTVIVSTSAQTSTGTYRRSSTGIGQVRAVADLAPKFSLAYWRCRLDQVFVADAAIYERIEGDLVCLGGEKTNAVTLELLRELRQEPGFPISPIAESKILWNDHEYASQGDGDTLSLDYGIIVRSRNPMSMTRGPIVLVLAGASTQGSHAASKVFTSDRWFRRSGDVAALVECQVRDGFPLRSRIVARAWRGPHQTAWITDDVLAPSIEEARQ